MNGIAIQDLVVQDTGRFLKRFAARNVAVVGLLHTRHAAFLAGATATTPHLL
jgi:hypothetical protein